jgi:hypothetical protein
VFLAHDQLLKIKTSRSRLQKTGTASV